MANSKSSSGCCGCVSGIIIAILVLALIVAFFVSKYVTVEQIKLADTPGILSRFSDAYTQEDTFRSQGMEKWKVYDVLLWIMKSGEYTPAN